jgi:hypothetical protein
MSANTLTLAGSVSSLASDLLRFALLCVMSGDPPICLAHGCLWGHGFRCLRTDWRASARAMAVILCCLTAFTAHQSFR